LTSLAGAGTSIREVIPMVRRLGPILLVLLTAPGCRTRDQEVPPGSAAEVLSRLGAAVRADELAEVWKLLDEGTRWSVMSIYKDRRRTCELIRAHYPKERQPGELRRCRAAEVATDAGAFFTALARRHRGRVIEPLARFKAPGKRSGGEGRVELSDGRHRLVFCKEERGWSYCGLRDYMDRLKTKAARDRVTVQENIESFR
jgi:hypothetical protein